MLQGKQSSKTLNVSAEVDALVRQMRRGFHDPLARREARQCMKTMLAAGKITANTVDDHGCPLLLSLCEVSRLSPPAMYLFLSLSLLFPLSLSNFYIWTKGVMTSTLADMIKPPWNADINIVDELGNTCMHICQYFKSKYDEEKRWEWDRMWTVLEEAYCNDTTANCFGLQALEMSQESIVTQIFRVLLEDIATSKGGGSSLRRGQLTESLDDAGSRPPGRRAGEDLTIKALSRKFASGHERDEHGRTMLMFAAAAGSMDLVKKLFQLKCDKDAQDSDGNTALHHAVMNDQEYAAAFIVRRGADTRTRNAAGLSAMQARIEAHAAHSDTVKEKKKAPKVAALDRVEEERSPEMEELHQKFIIAALGEQANMGIANARTGRGAGGGRSMTLNYSEFLGFLRAENLMHSTVDSTVPLSRPTPGLQRKNAMTADARSKILLSVTLAADIFRKVNKQFSHEEGFESGEMQWIHFKECLRHLAIKTGLDEICDVPLSELKEIKPMEKKKMEWDNWNLCSHTKDILQKDMAWMQRQLYKMASRAKETTSLATVATGVGVTTGKKKVRTETMDVYCKPLRVKSTKLYLPAFEKSREAEKKEMVAKHFFNLIDKDGSGTLTSYELKSAFEEYGFSAEEQETMFSLFDPDGSGAVTLNEFCQGLGKVNIQIEGRISKTSAIESHHAIALALR
jgi:hypothetical protein